MKNLTSLAMILMGLLIMSCGKEEGGDSSSSLSSKLKKQGIYIQTSNSTTSSNQFNQYGGTQLTIECRDVDSTKVNNSERLRYLNDLLVKVQKKQYMKINGRKYDSMSYATLIQQALMSLQNGGSYNDDPFNDPYFNDPYYNNGNNNNNNTYNNYNTYNRQCPNNILAQGSVQLYYKY